MTGILATRIVGIGASAGGLTALQQFLQRVPARSGLAYVVVQHLDPRYKGQLPALLQRSTPMPVCEAKEKMAVEPDRVYVIPPGMDLRVADRFLHLAQPVERRGLRLPIDVLFASLARDQGNRAIGVVLSGMGSDGTLGAQAIRAKGGITFAQEPASAQFDSMPKSAIEAGWISGVAVPGRLPVLIVAAVAGVEAPPAATQSIDDPQVPSRATDHPPIRRIFDLLFQRTGHDFSFYKENTVMRRIERRMAIHSLDAIGAYANFLKVNPQEIDFLFKELLIGVTGFFRDPAVWQYLLATTLPQLLQDRPKDRPLRAWVIGCSTGEEAYSLAMALVEAEHEVGVRTAGSIQIFASDLSLEAVAAARLGRFSLAIRDSVTPERLARYFTLRDGVYHVNQALRDLILFAQHDVIRDPPFTKLDLISCRNLMIYLDATLQHRLVPLLHYSLRANGVMVLGTSESIGRLDYLFTPSTPKLRIYLRQSTPSKMHRDLLVTSFPPLVLPNEVAVNSQSPSAPEINSVQTAAEQLLLQTQSPPAVIVNKSGDVIYISGHTGNYLEPAAGKTNWNFFAMARESLRRPLSEALARAAAQTEPVELRGLHVLVPGGTQVVDVSMRQIDALGVLRGMVMIVFRDVGRPALQKRRAKSPTAEAHAQELQQFRDEIQDLRQVARASQEQLQSANEELQSTNEELQSTNEELTTSKEEMQSMNEELQTINAEMQTKLDDLALAQSDMKNLLNSTEIAMLFLDPQLNVRRFTDRTSLIINLRDIDIGRPLSDLTTMLQYPGLHEDAVKTLQTLQFSERRVLTDDGRSFAVRIMPYRRLDNIIDGVVITFVDMSKIGVIQS